MLVQFTFGEQSKKLAGAEMPTYFHFAQKASPFETNYAIYFLLVADSVIGQPCAMGMRITWRFYITEVTSLWFSLLPQDSSVKQ